MRGRWPGRNGRGMKIGLHILGILVGAFVDDCYLREFSGLECAGARWVYKEV